MIYHGFFHTKLQATSLKIHDRF